MFLDSRPLNTKEKEAFQPLLERGISIKSILMPDTDDREGEWLYFAQKGQWTMHFYLTNLENERQVIFTIDELLRSSDS